MPPRSSFPTVTDDFCGAGGSSLGIQSAGGEVTVARNHDALAVASHSENFPRTAHYVHDIQTADPKDHPSTDFLWASTACTRFTHASGKKNPTGQTSLFDHPDPKAVRSRATMDAVPAACEVHRYNCVIVENVVEARDWEYWDQWIGWMHGLGYDYQVVYLNAMFAWPTRPIGSRAKIPAPQSRDRMFVVFWRRGNRKPNLDIHPKGWCGQCSKEVETYQWWKNPLKKRGKYGRRNQYLYRCPLCREEVVPYFAPAYCAIDWSLPCPKIGSRKRPLVQKTLERVAAGLAKFGGQPVQIPISRAGEPGRVRSVLEAFYAQTTQQEQALMMPPWVAAYYSGVVGNRIDQALTTVTTRDHHALVVPPTWIVEATGEYRHRPISEALSTVVAGGNHHFLASYYGNSTGLRLPWEPTGTVTTRDRQALVEVGPVPSIEECGLRMFEPHEIGASQGFPDEYIVLGTKEQKVRQFGHAVPPEMAQLLFERCLQTLDSRGMY